jgi:hypothetical protein
MSVKNMLPAGVDLYSRDAHGFIVAASTTGHKWLLGTSPSFNYSLIEICEKRNELRRCAVIAVEMAAEVIGVKIFMVIIW